MDATILYSWMGDKFIESYDAKCVMAHRMLAYKGIDYQIKTVAIPADTPKLYDSVALFPILSHRRQLYYEVSDVINFFSDHNPERSLFVKDPDNPHMGKLLTQWALECLSIVTLYFTVRIKNNWLLFYNDAKSMCKTRQEVKVIQSLRQHVRYMIRYSQYSRCDYRQMNKVLVEQLDMLEHFVGKSRYISGNVFNLADIAVFAHLHHLFHPYVAETSELISRYPGIISWAGHVDLLTSNEHTRKFFPFNGKNSRL